MPVPIKPMTWRTSQLAEADSTLEMFTAPIEDVKNMLSNFENLCRAGRWQEALVGLQMANKWILNVERDMLEFLGVSQEDTLSSNLDENIRQAMAMPGNRMRDNLQRLHHISNDISAIGNAIKAADFGLAITIVTRSIAKLDDLKMRVYDMDASGLHSPPPPPKKQNFPIWGTLYDEEGEPHMGWIDPSSPEYHGQWENWKEWGSTPPEDTEEWGPEPLPPSLKERWDTFFDEEEAQKDPRFQAGFGTKIRPKKTKQASTFRQRTIIRKSIPSVSDEMMKKFKK